MAFPRTASLKSHAQFRERIDALGLDLPSEETMESGPNSPLGAPIELSDRVIGNRFCILPMEGWDGTEDGRPTELTYQRWRNFGLSGAKWIWGGEAVAVRPDGRANPNQLLINESTARDLESLRQELVQTHVDRFGNDADLFVGLQLTHSGRYARPNRKDRPEPRIVYRHPILDRRLGITDDSKTLSDEELRTLIDQFANAATLAHQVGFDFVDVKHCHGYLGHELLSAIDRPGEFGGSFENRTRFLREIVGAIRTATPELRIGVRFSVFDFVPFRAGAEGVGQPEQDADSRYCFGSDARGLSMDLDDGCRLVELLQELGIELVCATAGTPYYNPHIQRPAYFPPIDGYQPPEDPLVGVARQITAVRRLKQRFPNIVLVGSGYSYLQDWLPHTAQAVVRRGWVDSVGLGRMVLSYPDLPADVLSGATVTRNKICRTFSDCTTGPRLGMISGCYPLDPRYKRRDERAAINAAKKRR